MGKAAKQRVNLPLGLFDCAVGMDDGIGELFFLRQGHLSVDAPLCLRSVEPVALSESLNLYEEGTALINACSKMLDEAEQKVVKLKKGPDRAPIELPFEDSEQ